MTDERLTTPNRRPEDLDAALRPKTLDEFVGQKAARENLRVFIEAAKSRGDALDLGLRAAGASAAIAEAKAEPGPTVSLDALMRTALKKAAR